MDNLHWEILDKERQKILPLLSNFKNEFYLAGGTALALHLGYRESIDFDFFSKRHFSTEILYKKIKKVFKSRDILKIQEDKDTLTVLIDKKIKISFFQYQYELIKPLVESEFIQLASIEDIGCMKFSAIVSRSFLKDYVDLYWILQRISLTDLLIYNQKKHHDLETNLVLKSLVYFDDVIEEPIIFSKEMEISFEEIKEYLRKTVREYVR